MSVQHFVVVEVSQDCLEHCRRAGGHPPEEDVYGWRIECSDRASCAAWIECDGDHSGMDPAEEASPAYDQYEDVPIHGVPHEWRWSHGWTVAYAGCAAEGHEGLMDPPDDVALDRPGRWLVDIDWDDDECTLIPVKEVTREDA